MFNILCMLYEATSHGEGQIDYDQRLDAILNTPLVVDRIDRYADDALDKLIALIHDAVEDYTSRPTNSFAFGVQTEAAAFHYFGLMDLDLVLGHLSAKADELHRLDSLLARVNTRNQVILPPDTSVNVRIKPGDGSFEEKNAFQRLKTILFILSNSFEVNVYDPAQVSITEGVLTPGTMRKASYRIVEAPALQRAIFVSDEAENATYVFNTEAAQQAGFTLEELAGLSKAELNTVLQAIPSVGQRIIFTRSYVQRLVNALELPVAHKDEPEASDDMPQEGQYLYPKAPEGTLSATGYAKKYGYSKSMVTHAIRACRQYLGSVHKYQFWTRTVPGYDEDQQRIIGNYIDAQTQASSPAPEGYLSVNGMHMHPDFQGVSNHTLDHAIEVLGDRLGDVNPYIFGNNITDGYSPDQQKLIWSWLNERGLFSPEASDDTLSLTGTAKDLGYPRPLVVSAVTALGSQLGEVRKRRFGPRLADGYTAEQRALIETYIVKSGKAVPKAPEQCLSAYGIYRANRDLSQWLVEKAIQELGDELTPEGPYWFGSQLTVGYPTDQQARIVAAARKRKR